MMKPVDQIRDAMQEKCGEDGVVHSWVLAYSVVNPEEGSFRHGTIASEGSDFVSHLGLATFLKAELEKISVGEGRTD